MVKYIIQAKKNNFSPDKKIMYYPQIAPANALSLAQIIKRIESRSTVSSPDVKAVLDALQTEVIDALQNGNTVRLGDLGSFRLTIKAGGVTTAAAAKKDGAALIKAVNVQFTKSAVMREAFKKESLEFGLQMDVSNAVDH